MAANAVILGPFAGGLNTASDASAIADNEVSLCVNFVTDLDGSLVCRPPIVETASENSLTERILFIGRAILAGDSYLIGSNKNGTFAFDGENWTLIVADLISRSAIQVHDHVFILAAPESPVAGGKWNGSTFDPDANAPRGSSALYLKGRVFITPGLTASYPADSQLKFTEPISLITPWPYNWEPTNLIPVGQGDGQKLVDMVVENDNLMLFKQDSTYVLAYDIQPSEAVLRKLNNNIGVTSSFCVVTHQNAVYAMHEGRVYQIVNYNWAETNVKVPFATGVVNGLAEEVSISLLGDLLVVRYFNSTYCLNLLTKTWSVWRSHSAKLNSLGPLVEMPEVSASTNLPTYYAGSAVRNRTSVVRIQDGYSFDVVEQDLDGPVAIRCEMETKVFDFGIAHQFKRLMWWGIDLISAGEVKATVSPIKQSFPATWADLAIYRWDSLGTWGQPIRTGGIVVEDTVPDPYILRRKFLKILKSLRFRQVSFKVALSSDGSRSTTTTLGPDRIFTLTALIGIKQTVVKKVT